MKHQDLLSNYQNDLIKSVKQPLLIELNQNEIEALAQSQHQYLTDIPLLLAKRIYDVDTKGEMTNVLVVDGDSRVSKERFILLEVLLEQLQDEIKSIKNIAIVKEVLLAGLSAATGGLLNELVGPYLDKGVDFLFDDIGDRVLGSLYESSSDHIDLSDSLVSNVESFLHDMSAGHLADLSGNINKRQLNLTVEARSELDTLSSTFAKSGKHDIFQLTFKILLATAIGSRKIVYINNPHKLDDNSIAIISLLLSYAKHAKDAEKHIGISFVYTYSESDFQPYREINDKYKTKKALLDDQRRFAQRYAMLERPSSDVPVVAVKSSHFVGRNDELKELSEYFEQRQGFTITAVSGEPGIGKTAIISKHLEQISTERMIVLTMLNEAGHRSSNTGLSSLERSIQGEASRLELLKNWKDRSADFIKGVVSKENAVDAIGKIFSGADKLINTANATYDRIQVDSSIEKTIEHGHGDLDSNQEDVKEQQFNKLDKAFKQLLKLSDRQNPLILFIDDSQWIDNSTSEYILTHLAKMVSLYIVTSVRPSDAATILKRRSEDYTENKYSLSFLKTIGINGQEKVETTQDIDHVMSNTLHLKGFDRKVLSELIGKVIKGNATQVNELSNSIITEISGVGAQRVNSLFAIESINMLCDDRLFSENNGERLILAEPIRFNNEVEDIRKALHNTFKTLRDKYSDSLNESHRLEGDNSFNLMAYAVLEERLHLIKLYFSEHGEAAVNTLLFSSLLGAPFSSNLVKNVIEALRENDEKLLKPLNEYLSTDTQRTRLTEEHYDIIEDVYQILKRYSVGTGKYQYQHELLNVFFENQLDNLLDQLFIDSDHQKVYNKLFEFIEKIIIKESNKVEAGDPHTSNNDEKTFYLRSLSNVMKKAYTKHPEKWCSAYVCSLSSLIEKKCYPHDVLKNISIHEEIISICESRWDDHPSLLSRLYCESTHRLALLCARQDKSSSLVLDDMFSAVCEELSANPQVDWSDEYGDFLLKIRKWYFVEDKANAISPLATDTKLTTNVTISPQNRRKKIHSYLSSLRRIKSMYTTRNDFEKLHRIREIELACIELYIKLVRFYSLPQGIVILNELIPYYHKNQDEAKTILLGERALYWSKDYYHDEWAKAKDYPRATKLYVSSLVRLFLNYTEFLYFSSKPSYSPMDRRRLDLEGELIWFLKRNCDSKLYKKTYEDCSLIAFLGKQSLYREIWFLFYSRTKVSYNFSEKYFDMFFDLFDYSFIRRVSMMDIFIETIILQALYFELLGDRQKLKDIRSTSIDFMKHMYDHFPDKFPQGLEKEKSKYLRLSEDPTMYFGEEMNDWGKKMFDMFNRYFF